MEEQKVKIKKSAKRWAVLVLAILSVVILFDVFIIGNISYAAMWAQCGSRPVVAGKKFSVGFGAAPERVVIRQYPSFFEAKRQISGGFYCSIDQAKAAFPNAGQIDIQ